YIVTVYGVHTHIARFAYSVGAVPMMPIFLELFHMTVFWIKPPLRLSGTYPQGEAFSAPIEGSCRQSRLRGGIKFSNISKGMLIASLNTEMF
ncbi:MAG: hypothetical protein Q3Y24_01370, partial [Clostridia bacterium]|nr:hypothetical protein [Clostridia bacterium]